MPVSCPVLKFVGYHKQVPRVHIQRSEEGFISPNLRQVSLPCFWGDLVVGFRRSNGAQGRRKTSFLEESGEK